MAALIPDEVNYETVVRGPLGDGQAHVFDKIEIYNIIRMYKDVRLSLGNAENWRQENEINRLTQMSYALGLVVKNGLNLNISPSFTELRSNIALALNVSRGFNVDDGLILAAMYSDRIAAVPSFEYEMLTEFTRERKQALAYPVTRLLISLRLHPIGVSLVEHFGARDAAYAVYLASRRGTRLHGVAPDFHLDEAATLEDLKKCAEEVK